MVVSHKIKESVTSVVIDYTKVLGVEWTLALRKTLDSTYMDNLQCFIRETYRSSDQIYPRNPEDIFRALELTPIKNLKAVIFADNPFPSTHANGLAFGSFKTCRGMNKLPQTLAIEQCLAPDSVTLTDNFDPTMRDWAEKGVLMLSTALITNKEQDPKYNLVFRNFIREVIEVVNQKMVDCVFVFTSQKQAQTFAQYIDLAFNHMLVYPDGITADCSIFTDINMVLEREADFKATIEW